MKKFFCILGALIAGTVAFAQTPEEIVSRMEEAMKSKNETSMAMTMDIKIPILGTMSTRAYVFGEKLRIEGKVKDQLILTWIDGDVERTYDSAKNEITVTKHDTSKPTDAQSNAAMFKGVADGYDLSLSKETADAWYIRCKKSRTNTDKDDPKTMDLVVSKDSYYPVCLSTKLSGVSVTIRDLSFDVTEQQVTFNPADYPPARVVDMR